MSPGLGEIVIVVGACIALFGALAGRSPWLRQLWKEIVDAVRGWDAERCQNCGADLADVAGPRCPKCGALKGYRPPRDHER